MRKTVKRYLSENREQKEVIDGKIISKDIFGRATIQTATGTFKAIDLRGKGTTGVKINNAAQNQNEFAIIAGNQERNINQPTYYDLPNQKNGRIVTLYPGGVYEPDYDHDLDRIQSYDLKGNLTSFFFAKSINDYLYYIAVDENKNFYVTMVEVIDYPRKSKIQKFDRYGKLLKEYVSTSSPPLYYGIDYKNGYVYVAAKSNILKFDSDLFPVQTFPLGMSATSEIKVDSHENMIVSFGSKHVVRSYTSLGILQFTMGKSDFKAGSGDGEFNYAYGLALDTKNNIYVCDYFNNRIQKFDSSGNFLSKFDVTSGYPNSIACDTNGNLYVSDASGSKKIQVFNSSGENISEFGIDLPESETKYGAVYFYQI